MGNLIFLIIIIVIVRNVMEQKKKTGGVEKHDRNAAVSSNRNKQAASRSASKAFQSAASAFGTADHKAKSTKRASGTSAGAERWNAGAEEEDISTTEYLRQKALEDQQEHEEQARLEAMRLRRETGGRRAAQRHYDGDSIPKGMRLVRCGYCGAENLIGDYEKQSDFTCYFCREIL